MKNLCLASAVLVACGSAAAAPVKYNLDPEHTYPSFEADHMGLSIWRGKFDRTTGTVMMDRETGTGTVEVTIDIASIDFGHPKVTEYMMRPDQFDSAKYPTASYKGRLVRFVDGAPTAVTGELTMRGVTRPVDLKIDSFKCIPHPILKRELCGADAYGTFKRDEFGMDYGPQWGFKPDVVLRIQVEALRAE